MKHISANNNFTDNRILGHKHGGESKNQAALHLSTLALMKFANLVVFFALPHLKHKQNLPDQKKHACYETVPCSPTFLSGDRILASDTLPL